MKFQKEPRKEVRTSSGPGSLNNLLYDLKIHLVSLGICSHLFQKDED